ncbi:MAG: hypothetical protein RLZZ126_1842 [Pseudomonadota bacterium]
MACSPALNWREVRLPSGGFSGLLPCKAEASERVVELAGTSVRMAQLSCTVDGATYALVEARVPDTTRATAALAHWRLAAFQNVKASVPVEAGLKVAGVVGSVQLLSATGQHPGGGALAIQAAWWAVSPHLYHAAVYSPPQVSARTLQEVHESFFGGLKVVAP